MKYNHLSRLLSGPPEPATIRLASPIRYSKGTAEVDSINWLEEPEEPEGDYYPDPEGADYYEPPDDEFPNEIIPDLDYTLQELRGSYSAEDASKEAYIRFLNRLTNGDI